MKRNVLAPQGGSAPEDGRPLTAADLLALPEENGRRFELHAGKVVRKPVAGGGHDYVAFRLVMALGRYVEEHDLGAITLSQAGYDVTRPGEPATVLIPDLAFVRKERVPAPNSPEWSRFWPLAPDLVVEVVSPSQHRPEMEARAQDWIERGVEMMWLVWPASRTVDVWVQSSGAGGPSAVRQATLAEADELDGLHFIPGFKSLVAEIIRGVR